MTDLCHISDLPRSTCWHCGARPGDRPNLELPRVSGAARRDAFEEAPEPSTWATGRDVPNLRLRSASDESCACGRPTRDAAFGCDDCADELSRFLGDVPWLVEQLDVTITGQRAKRPGTGGAASSDTDLRWNAKAANVRRALRTHLAIVVKLCERRRVAHQSPYQGLPTDEIEAMSRWLLWRVDGLTLVEEFVDTLRDSLAIEKRAYRLIDRKPDRMFLGMCELAKVGVCDGAVYVTLGSPVGKCRVCGMKYDPEDRRRSLEAALDDRLCTAAEIAHLATYLGIEAKRDVVRNRVNQWRQRGQIVPKATGLDKMPRYRYGDVAPLLSALYDKREKRA